MLRRIASTVLPSRWGVFRMLGFEQTAGNGGPHVETAVVLTLGDPTQGAPLLRIHSQCLTGEVLKSLRCDCGDQLELAMRSIAEERCGVLIYEHQEGRGIGLMAKLRAYALQDEGLDTIAANQALGFEADSRDFRLPVAVLNHLGIRRVRLLSNNPQKLRALVEGGIDVVARIPCETPPSPHALIYLRSKKERMGHALSLL
jgi:GTP cyclohydrolase II